MEGSGRFSFTLDNMKLSSVRPFIETSTESKTTLFDIEYPITSDCRFSIVLAGGVIDIDFEERDKFSLVTEDTFFLIIVKLLAEGKGLLALKKFEFKLKGPLEIWVGSW